MGSDPAVYDAIVIGGGVAGVSLAYFLTELGMTRVLLLEQERGLAQHASGRSAQVLLELERDLVVHRAIVAGGRFLRQPPADFSTQPLFNATGILLLYDEPEWSDIQIHVPAWRAAGTRIELWQTPQIRARVPVLTGDPPAGALYLPECGRLNVPALIEAYARGASARGAIFRKGACIAQLLIEDGCCTGVWLDNAPVRARWVVNAAGPWAGVVGRLAEATPIAFHPLRRSVVSFESPAVLDVQGWPMVSCPSRRLYFATEGEGMLACPMDETPCEPQDIQPDPADIHTALERLAALAPDMTPVRVRAVRAGLRTFSPDRRFVVGEDPRRPGFFWLAGQGGWGIETSPILSRIAAEVMVQGRTDWADWPALDVARFAR